MDLADLFLFCLAVPFAFLLFYAVHYRPEPKEVQE